MPNCIYANRDFKHELNWCYIPYNGHHSCHIDWRVTTLVGVLVWLYGPVATRSVLTTEVTTSTVSGLCIRSGAAPPTVGHWARLLNTVLSHEAVRPSPVQAYKYSGQFIVNYQLL